jgi:Fe-S-cluster formation regulator IscX/YfhJ
MEWQDKTKIAPKLEGFEPDTNPWGGEVVK